MKCPKCQFENRERANFCLKCGEKLELNCPHCGKELPLVAEFCDECGQKLGEVVDTEKKATEIEGERKHVTILFSDLSGYTAMSEKLDPEEVKEIMSRIFGEVAQVIARYEGFIDKFIGDAVMAVFGIPKTHEDDPIRAIKAAQEIHDLVDTISPQYEARIGRSLAMHSGINTGLVVTGEMGLGKGQHSLTGDTINLASRLEGLSRAGEILVGENSYRQAEGYFDFEALQPTSLKGKSKPVRVYKVLSLKTKPSTTRRLSGLRADLIGRKMEMAELGDVLKNLREGKGRIFSIVGDAGTGKSRLVEDYKRQLDPREIQWFEGHAYAYSQNIPYSFLIDMLNRIFQIEEDDPSKTVKEKIESEIEALLGKKNAFIPYVGSLYSLNYPELEEMSPEFWKTKMQEAVIAIFTAIAQQAPTFYFLEDLHWADPSSVELIRRACLEFKQPAVVLCAFRPQFSLFKSHQMSDIGTLYHEIRLHDLSQSEAQDMLASLLKTNTIPTDLKRLIQKKTEGNPFYLEELINTLVETEILVEDNGHWETTKPVSEIEISSSIHGLISGRLDRLEMKTKRIL